MNHSKRPQIYSRSIAEGLNNNPRPQRLMPEPQPRSNKILKSILFIILLAIIGLGGFVLARASNLGSKIFVGQNTSFFKQVGSLIQSTTGGTKLQGEKDGQINVLLLGIGGEGHDGPYLSDTVIVVQIRPGDKKATMISIPRDYLVNLGNGTGFRKINEAFSYGFTTNKNNWNEGGRMSRKVVEDISDLTIPYFAVVDFKGFERAIDMMEGIDVQIDRTFTDYTFPNDKGGYIGPVTFKQGTERMSGKRALIFARSRHAAGPEGSDFARSQRQQKIIQATKAKAVELNLVTDAKKINSLFSVVGDHVHTNLTPGELFHLYELIKDYNQDNITSLSLDPATGLICDGKIESTGAYVLQACAGKTKADIRAFFASSFSSGKLLQEKAVVWLADSTPKQTLYQKAAKRLQDAGITVYQISYKEPLAQNVVYAANSKPATLEFLKETFDASEVSLPPPGVKVSKDKVDLIVILGVDTINETAER
jgi:polyisoprenyl-teichoic acid--peptidoglycan teichoic acid transferase